MAAFLHGRTVFYEHVLVSPEGLVKMQIAGPQPQSLSSDGSVAESEGILPARFQMTMLCGPVL